MGKGVAAGASLSSRDGERGRERPSSGGGRRRYTAEIIAPSLCHTKAEKEDAGGHAPGVRVRTRNATLVRYGLSFVIPLPVATVIRKIRPRTAAGKSRGRLNTICISSAIRRAAFGRPTSWDSREFILEGWGGDFLLLVEYRSRKNDASGKTRERLIKGDTAGFKLRWYERC